MSHRIRTAAAFARPSGAAPGRPRHRLVLIFLRKRGNIFAGIANMRCQPFFWHQRRLPRRSMSTTKSSGKSGTPSRRLHTGQGSPGAPQPHACGPSQGRSGWASQTHRLLSQRPQNLIAFTQTKRPRAGGLTRGRQPWGVVSRPLGGNARSIEANVWSLRLVQRVKTSRACLIIGQPYALSSSKSFGLLQCRVA